MTKKTLKLIQYISLFILIIFLFIGGPQLFDTRSFKKFWDLGHIVLFALFFIIILRDSKWLNRKNFFTQFIMIIGFTIIIGALIEVIQLLIGRTSEFIDIWRSIVGSLIAIAFFKNYSNIKQYKIRIVKAIVILLLFAAAWPLIKTITDEIQAQIDFPVIANFENRFEIEKWYGQSYISLSDEYVQQGNSSLKSELLTTKYSGISISYFPTDWQKFSTVKFNVFFLGTDSLRLTCRMHDKIHNNQFKDRFNKSFFIKNGWNEISINLAEVINAPADRQMDISEMKNFALFAVQLKERKIIYFDYLRLE